MRIIYFSTLHEAEDSEGHSYSRNLRKHLIVQVLDKEKRDFISAGCHKFSAESLLIGPVN